MSNINLNSSEPVYYGGELPEVVKYGQNSAENIEIFPEGSLNKGNNTAEEIISNGVTDETNTIVNTNSSLIEGIITSMAEGKTLLEAVSEVLNCATHYMIDNAIGNLVDEIVKNFSNTTSTQQDKI